MSVRWSWMAATVSCNLALREIPLNANQIVKHLGLLRSFVAKAAQTAIVFILI